jgi:CIC family chloride channel protein
MNDVPVRKHRYRVPGGRLLSRYFPLVQEDLTEVYSRDLQKWLLVSPFIGLTTGLAITGIAALLLGRLWPAVLNYYLGHHWAIVPGLVLAFAATGVIMQYLTPDPDEHSTEEVIRSYHEHEGAIDMRPFAPKLLAAITTVGFGGSAALEGPSIYGGAAIGSWLWTKLRRFHFTSRDRRIMLICGAAAGMSAVFRAPLTGIVFALEMPYRDDLAHEALLPSLIASVVSYVTLGSFLGSAPLFNFHAISGYDRHDLYWSALLGLLIGLIAMAFVVTFRRVRVFFVQWSIPHWLKLTLGGLLTGLCGVLFLHIYPGSLVPIGPNYEAVGEILNTAHSTSQLLVFSGLKLAATVFTLASGGVSAMFVPLFLTGGCLGTAFAQSIVHSSSLGLYAAVGMASFIAAGYKTPLAAVVFVAEATGGHAFIIPSLIGAAIAYAVSGDASASGDQRLHETARTSPLRYIAVSEIMQPHVISAPADLSLREFVQMLSPDVHHEAFPVFDNGTLLGTVNPLCITHIPPEHWAQTRLRDVVERGVGTVAPDCDVMEALRLLTGEHRRPMLLVISEGKVKGIVTKTDILQVLKDHGAAAEPERKALPLDTKGIPRR